MTRARFTVAGGGPVGSLLAILLARHGYRVGLYEGRADSRLTSIYQGKSINIALSDRGWRSMEQIGIGSEAMAAAIPMYHRAIHGVDGTLSALAYGKHGDAIWSVSRGGINERLLDIADAEPNIEIRFEHRLVDVDLETASAVFLSRGEHEVTVEADYLFGADGAHSKVRRLARGLPGFDCSETRMPQGYIELTIPASSDGSHRIEKNALHIWPRKEFMLIALPNPDGSFTCTLFLNHLGDPSFESLQERSCIRAFFESNFADAMAYLEDPIDVFLEKTPSPLFLVQVFPWSFNRRVGLIGDAAHAIVPFYGQGMNCGFEDCAELDRLIELHDHDWEAIFPAYEDARKPNGDAIAELSMRNFVEMSDLSGDKRFQLRKKIEAKFSSLFPDLWTPLYSMVTFSPDVPYSEALRIGDEQHRVMEKIMVLPGIEEDWDNHYVMNQLQDLALKTFGDRQ
ncbi:MAG: NAD(P)/FAD-dependent oxidoreductase [Rhodospirillaceae bacterium]|nr:NAD(P)/FAD-dependent oxidoreductase [Rhodospirillaceae bacterium]MDE0362185.1 NAD(P)/FAD-dependent oxidoreductase [Rhodospirillaceae bacterium]